MTTVAPDERSAAPAAATYRAHLDGLRAVAVGLVIAFHAGIGRLSGGFIGVDVFFVLSGFLVTRLLLRDLDQTGSVRLGRFYSRRMRRLLPAALVTLIGTALIFTVIASPLEALDARGAVRASALWFSNWYFIAESADYFAADVAASPVLHFWSLSIEEQFYLLWPLLLAGLFRLCRPGDRGLSRLRLVVAGLALASLAAAWWIGRTDITRAYYGTDTRAYQLLAGALLALTPTVMSRFGGDGRTRGPAWVAAAALGALAVLATSWWEATPVSRGMAATAVTVVLIVALEASAGGARRALSLAPVVYLGKISYGIYLWHWIVILSLEATVELGSVPTAVATAVVASGLASLSYQVLEMPVRSSTWLDGRGRVVIVAGLAASLVVGLVVGPWLLERDRAGSVAPTATEAPGQTPIPAGVDWEEAAEDRVENPRCRPGDEDRCVIVEGGEPHVLLLGDSTASMYLPALEAMAEQGSFQLSAAASPGCGWVRGIQRVAASDQVGPLGRTGAEFCRDIQQGWYEEVIPAIDPDVVIAVHRPYDDPANPIPLQDEDLGELPPDSPELAEAYEQRVRAAVADLQAGGAQVVILEPGPAATAEQDPLVCLSGATYLEPCRFEASGATAVEQINRAVAAEDPDVWSIDVDPLVCPRLPICDPVVDGEVVRWDSVHLTAEFSKSLAGALGERLRDAGALG